jgi:hypothetical protein
MNMISIQASVSKGWLNKNGGFEFDAPYYLDPLYRREQDRRIESFLNDRFPEYGIYNMESNLQQIDHVSGNQVLVGGIQPNLILGLLLGAEYVVPPDRDADIRGIPLQGYKNESLPSVQSLLAHPFVQKLESQIRSLLSERPEWVIIPPFFWDASGRATIHGMITTSLKLCGQSILMDLLEEPKQVQAMHAWITEVYIALIRHFAGMIDFPITSVHIGECSSTMLGANQFTEFISPYVDLLGQELGSIRMHTCGHSDHLLPVIREIDSVNILDTGSRTHVARIRDIFGPDFEIHLAPPVELMMDQSEKQFLTEWLDQTLEENQGGPLLLNYHLESDYSLEACLALHDTLMDRGLITPGRKSIL